MTTLEIIVLGIIEGITEFLPISSTGHLIVVGHWLSIEQTETNKAIGVIIQFAAILAVIANYRDKFSSQHAALWSRVALAFVPIGIVGFLFSEQIKALFTVPVVGTMFIIGGVVFLIVERFYREQDHHVKDVEDITIRQALWVGVAQLFALIPGTSRAGASIIGGLLTGLSRKTSAEFSFLLALPVLGAAAGYDLVKHHGQFSADDLWVLTIGFIVSFIVAYATIRLFLSFLERFTFVAFGVYRILFGALLLWLM